LLITIIDQGAVAGAFALRCAEHGHTVKWFIEPKPGNNQKIGTGLHPSIERVKQWLPWAGKSDLVVSTENGNYLPKLEMLRKRGIAVFAPSQAVADLEIDRKKGMDFLEAHGIKVPEYKTFKNIKEAQKYVYDNPARYVFKTLGDNDNKALSFVGKTPQQMIQQLQTWMDNKVPIKGDVMLQEFIEGVEFGCSRWVGKDGFFGPIEESFEHKKLFPSEKGVNTGEMGTVAKYVTESKLFDKVLKPLEEDLVKMGAFTSVDINCIIDKKGNPWPLEFTSRWGWPIFNLVLYAHKGDPAQWMYDACKGKETLKASKDVMIGIVLVIPPFPFEDKDQVTENIPIYGITKKNWENIQPQSVMAGKFIDEVDGEMKEVDGWVTAGSYVLVVVETGKTIEDSRDKVYKIVGEISISDMGYRDDIGEKVIKNLPELQKHGFAGEWEKADDNGK